MWRATSCSASRSLSTSAPAASRRVDELRPPGGRGARAGASGPRRCSSCPPIGGYSSSRRRSHRTPVRSGSPRTSSPRASRACARRCSRPSSSATFALDIDISPEHGSAFLQSARVRGIPAVPVDLRRTVRSPELKKVGQWLRESLAGDVTTLQVVSRGFPVPWPLMYLTDRFDAAPLAWDNFIGMRHVVEQIPMARDLGDAARDDDRLDAATSACACCTTTASTRRCRRSPSPRSARYWGAPRRRRSTEGTRVDDLVKSALARGATDKVLYLYCHAVASTRTPTTRTSSSPATRSVTLGQLAVFAPDRGPAADASARLHQRVRIGRALPELLRRIRPLLPREGSARRHRHGVQDARRFASEWAKAFFDELFAGERARRRRPRTAAGVPRRARQPARPALRRALRHRHASSTPPSLAAARLTHDPTESICTWHFDASPANRSRTT